jgi:LL-diaminopimelate aminotransferase
MGSILSVHALWKRRQDAKSNGVSYPIQRAAAAAFTPTGISQVKALVANYMERATYLLAGLKGLGYTVFGGVDAPYLWVKTPDSFDSWSFFDHLLERARVISLPGSGFGRHGEGFIRLTAFAQRESIDRALERLKNL